MNREDDNTEAWDARPVTFRCTECGERWHDERDARQCAYYDRNPAALARLEERAGAAARVRTFRPR